MTPTKLNQRISDIILDTWPSKDELGAIEVRLSDSAAETVVAALGVLPEIADERERQDEKWGEQNHPDGTGPGYRAQALDARIRCRRAERSGLVTYKDILEEEVYEAFAETDPVYLREELIQVAAVAVAWIEKLDRERAASNA